MWGALSIVGTLAFCQPGRGRSAVPRPFPVAAIDNGIRADTPTQPLSPRPSECCSNMESGPSRYRNDPVYARRTGEPTPEILALEIAGFTAAVQRLRMEAFGGSRGFTPEGDQRRPEIPDGRAARRWPQNPRDGQPLTRQG